MRREYEQTNTIPLAKVGELTNKDGKWTLANIMGYGECMTCGTINNKLVGQWGKWGVTCSKCSHRMYYEKRFWRIAPMIKPSEFDITKLKSPIPQVEPPKKHDDFDPQFLAIHEALIAIIAELKELNRVWSMPISKN